LYARIVTFQLDGPTPAEYEAHGAAIASTFTTWPGLVAKVWLADDDAGTFGGIYLFADRAAAARASQTDVYRAMATNPAFRDLTVREFDVLEEPTSITAAVLTSTHAEVGGA
jgi:hypothetical protein